MAEVSADPTPPPIPDPALENLNVEQLAQLVNEINPEVFYQRAQAFDTAVTRLQDVRDAFRRESRQLQEAWTGKIAESFENVAQETSGTITNILHPMQDPGYGTRLRQAGDALAMSQQRLKELQAQKTQQAAAPVIPGTPPEAAEAVEKGNQQTAAQIVRDLCTAYRDIGTGIAPLPETTPVSSGNAGAITGPAGSGNAPVIVARHSGSSATGADGNVVLLAGSGGVPAVRGGSDESYSRAQAAHGEAYVPHAAVGSGILGGPGGFQYGSDGGSHGSGGGSGDHKGEWSVEPSFLMSPGGTVYTGESVVGRARSVDAGADETTAVAPGIFPGCVGADDPVPVKRRAVTGESVDGVAGRRHLVSDPVDGVLGRAQPRGTPPAGKRRLVVKAKGEKTPVTVSDGNQGSVEDGKKATRPMTVAEPVVVARSEGEPAVPVTDARKAVDGVPALASTASAVPVVVDMPALTTAAGTAVPLVPIDRAPLVLDAGAAAGGGAPQSVLQVRALSDEGAPALPGASSVSVGTPQQITGSAPMEGGPMSPMMGMGGMGGQQEEGKERTSDMVPGPDPDVWDYSHGASSALGRPEQTPAEPEVQKSPVDLVARILGRT